MFVRTLSGPAADRLSRDDRKGARGIVVRANDSRPTFLFLRCGAVGKSRAPSGVTRCVPIGTSRWRTRLELFLSPLAAGLTRCVVVSRRVCCFHDSKSRSAGIGRSREPRSPVRRLRACKWSSRRDPDASTCRESLLWLALAVNLQKTTEQFMNSNHSSLTRRGFLKASSLGVAGGSIQFPMVT